jgi:hypothetical protein
LILEQVPLFEDEAPQCEAQSDSTAQSDTKSTISTIQIQNIQFINSYPPQPSPSKPPKTLRPMPRPRWPPQLPLLTLVPKTSRHIAAAEQHSYRAEERLFAVVGLRFGEHGWRVEGSGGDVAREDVVVVFDGWVVQDGVELVIDAGAEGFGFGGGGGEAFCDFELWLLGHDLL